MKNPLRFIGYSMASFDHIIPIISLVAWILGKILQGWREYQQNPPEKE